MITAIDSNILYDILGDDVDFSQVSQNSVQKQSQQGSLIISPIVYAELLVYFLKKSAVDIAVGKLKEFLQDLGVRVHPFSEQDFVIAAQAWGRFSMRKSVECPKCGTENIFVCSKCKLKVSWRNHIMTDFMIGAHAQNNAGCLLTRDRGYYKKYFKVEII